ncbi:MAG: hypothetical protein CMF50_07775 [Legionellales bacterium]|nr:hypothetical protein [Legionellales bacterium]|tara:strand:+ start:15949 stop:17292 length:1344 start_codon:yes stop_codon:yes gene_type:complete
MKLYKPKYHYWFYTLFLYGIPFVISYYYADWIPPALPFSAILLVLAGLFVLGTKREDLNLRGFWRTWPKVLFTQMLLLLVFTSIYLTLVKISLPVDTTTLPATPVLLTEPLKWGLYPWSLLLLVAMVLMICRWEHDRYGLLSSAIDLSYKNGISPAAMNFFETPLSVTNYFAVIITASLISISISILAGEWVGLPLSHGLQFTTFFVLFGIILLGSNRYILKAFNTLHRLQIPLWLFVLICCLGLSLCLSLVNSLFVWLEQVKVLTNIVDPRRLVHTTWHSSWFGFTWGYWLTIAMLAGSYFATVCRHLSRLATMVCLLLGPLLLLLLDIGLSQTDITVNINTLLATPNYCIITLLGSLSFFVIVSRFKEPIQLSRGFLIQGLPACTKSSPRFYKVFFAGICMMTALLLLTGVLLTQVLLFVVAVPFLLFSLIGIIGLLRVQYGKQD